MEPFGVQVQLTEAENVAARLQITRNTYGNRRLVLGLVIGAGGLVIASQDPFIGIVFIAYGVLVASGLFLRIAAQRAFRANPRAGELSAIAFSPPGFTVTATGYEARYAWARVLRLVVSAQFVLLETNRGQALIVPRRVLPPAGLEQLCAWCAAAGGPITPTAA